MTAVVALTDRAAALAVKIKESCPGTSVFIPRRYGEKYPGHCYFEGGPASLIREIWREYPRLVFIMAAGIVVRLVAPLLEGKDADPAVVVLDERGEHVVSLLSGHLGGANELARELAALIGAKPVITTATDVEELPALDELARKNGCILENSGDWKKIALALLDGRKVGLYSTAKLGAEFPPHVERMDGTRACGEGYAGIIYITEKETVREKGRGDGLPYIILRPRNIIAGVGCRRDTKKEEITSAVLKELAQNDISRYSLSHLATIEYKKDEPGLAEAAKELGVPLLSITAREIAAVEDRFAVSSFVQAHLGVGAVAEPAAWLAAKEPFLIAGKSRHVGVTVALVKDRRVVIG
ncbi:MAG: cobalt-precorrin 5A hydrolase [Peptococcaceae bacterium]|jgi:cobalt-precorrin 5A hydrolase|nr:cobalt-precorrin 5A hydrolase [Peptococcaceae bacterium]MDH7525788.1 cobalt-precorrin 5A hydrolase [Peptococcaceae bacterium]